MKKSSLVVMLLAATLSVAQAPIPSIHPNSRFNEAIPRSC